MEGRVGGRVLELGCGTGKNTGWLAERAERLVACDFSTAMMEKARERVAGVEFYLCDIRGEWPVDRRQPQGASERFGGGGRTH